LRLLWRIVLRGRGLDASRRRFGREIMHKTMLDKRNDLKQNCYHALAREINPLEPKQQENSNLDLPNI
jgi:hypothetical protein